MDTRPPWQTSDLSQNTVWDTRTAVEKNQRAVDKQNKENTKMKRTIGQFGINFALLLTLSAVFAVTAISSAAKTYPTKHQTKEIEGVEVFYREAGPKDAPAVLLLHGFPTSSHMFRNLIPALSDRYRVVAPDYPGFGNSAQPSMNDFEYSFENYSRLIEKLLVELEISRYSNLLNGLRRPRLVFRIAARNPEKVDALIVQNGNAYDEGLREFWDPIKKYWKNKTPEKR